jgi:hypothetical protein
VTRTPYSATELTFRVPGGISIGAIQLFEKKASDVGPQSWLVTCQNESKVKAVSFAIHKTIVTNHSPPPPDLEGVSKFKLSDRKRQGVKHTTKVGVKSPSHLSDET